MDDTFFFGELDKIQKKADDDAVSVFAEKSEPRQAPPMSSEQRLSEARIMLERIGRDVQSALAFLKDGTRTASMHWLEASLSSLPINAVAVGTVIEGTFDGTGMLGSDGKRYTMAPNYASKSKLVEGDSMKLTITPEGSFIYKQVHPIERRRVMGVLVFDSASRQYTVRADEQSWKVLTASITYYKGIPGDEIVIFVPKEGMSGWGAVEHIIKKI